MRGILGTVVLAVLLMAIADASPGEANPGTAVRFFGTGAGDTDRIKLRIDAPANSADIGGGDFTIEFWMKADAGNNGDGCSDWICGNIIFDRDINGFNVRDYGISINSNDSLAPGGIYFGTGGGLEHVLRGDQDVRAGGWHHVAVTRVRATGQKCLYVDGALDVACENGTTEDISYPDGYAGAANDPYLVVGAEKHDAGPLYPSFFGTVDEIRIWNTARSAAEINTSKGVSLSGADAGLVAYWRLDEGSGTVAGDSSGDGNNGTVKDGLAGAAEWAASTAPIGGSGPTAGAYALVQDVTTANFSRMVDFAVIPGTSGQEAVVVSQQTAIVRRVSLTGAFAPAVYGDLSDRVQTAGNEEGLLSLAFSPNFVSDGRVYVYYTSQNCAGVITRCIRISRFPVVANDMVEASETVVLEITQLPAAEDNHNGGRALFGPDGYLYLSTGDGGGGGDPGETGQNNTDLLGSVLRINVTGEATYTVPADNPFVGVAGADEVWAYGLRNPWRFSFDRVSGELWLADVGQSNWEEVEEIVKGGNYGWDCYEGFVSYEPAGCPPSGFQFPRAVYGHGSGCSVTGGYVYRGTLLPHLYGWYVYADYCSGRIWAVNPLDSSAAVQLVDSPQQIASFAERPDGELLVLAFNNTIYRLTCNGLADADSDDAADACDVCPSNADCDGDSNAPPGYVTCLGNCPGGHNRDGVELWAGTSITDRCADSDTADNEVDDKWPPDYNDDRSVSVLDFPRWKVYYPDPSPLAGEAAKRSDLNADDAVNALDFPVWKAYFPSTCVP